MKLHLFKIFFGAFLIMAASDALSQSITVTSQGVSGDMDTRDRDPVVSVTRVIDSEAVKLLVDAHVPDPKLRNYPIRFEFYVNRRLFTSQIRSSELPGPIGVDIGPDIATIPFNYTVIAQILHPNRIFTTVVNGAAFSEDLLATLSCALRLGSEDEGSTFRASAVETLQAGENAFSFGFDASIEDSSESVQVAATVNTSGGQGSATLRVIRNNLAQDIGVSGPVTVEDGRLTEFSLSSEDSTTLLICN